MPSTPIQLAEANPIGRVTAVDTSKAYIQIDDHDKLKMVIVGNLVAIQGATGHQYLIAIVERITRLPGEVVTILDEVEGDSGFQGDALQDTVRVVLVGTYWTDRGGKGPTFKRGADTCPQIDQPCYLLEGENLTNFMGTLAGGIQAEAAIELGTYVIDPDAKAVADGNRFFQRHAAIVGSTGSGKSCAVALLLERARKLAHPNLIVLDMHGEYASLCEGPDAYAIRMKIAGPGDLQKPDKDTLFLPYWLLNREEMLAMLLDRSDTNAPNQATVFTKLVRDAKDRSLAKGNREDVRATFTVDSPIPYSISEVLAELADIDSQMTIGSTGREKQGEWYSKLTRFISRLDAKITDRRYGFLFQPPNDSFAYDWLAYVLSRLMGSPDGQSGIKVIDFSEVPGDVLPVVAGVFARLIYDVQFWMAPGRRTPICIVCDEAHLYLPVRDESDAPSKRALEAFERIAKEGRKYGLALLVVSQRPSDVSRTILSQCNNFVALRLTNEHDQSAVRSVMPDSMAAITDVLPLLDIGEAMVLGDAVLLPSRVKLQLPKLKPLSLTRDFWSEWTTQTPDEVAIQEAVEALRSQSRRRDNDE